MKNSQSKPPDLSLSKGIQISTVHRLSRHSHAKTWPHKSNLHNLLNLRSTAICISTFTEARKERKAYHIHHPTCFVSFVFFVVKPRNSHNSRSISGRMIFLHALCASVRFLFSLAYTISATQACRFSGLTSRTLCHTLAPDFINCGGIAQLVRAVES